MIRAASWKRYNDLDFGIVLCADIKILHTMPGCSMDASGTAFERDLDHHHLDPAWQLGDLCWSGI